MFIATEPERHLGRSVDNGHCVRYAQVATPALPHTSQWRRGRKVRNGNVEPGTVIATFGASDRYENRTDGSSHAAILVAENPEGLLVLDQWVGHPVAQRTIRYKGGSSSPAADDGDAFYVVIV